jgi:hypothetical protein
VLFPQLSNFTAAEFISYLVHTIRGPSLEKDCYTNVRVAAQGLPVVLLAYLSPRKPLEGGIEFHFPNYWTSCLFLFFGNEGSTGVET